MNNKFNYNYSAPSAEEKKEIESIRKSYLPQDKNENKLELLRKLDFKVTNIPVSVSIAVGVVGLLIFGLGLAMCLEWSLWVWGVIVSCIGIIPISLAYPIYLKVHNKLKNKYSDQILKLSNELLEE